MNKKNKIPIHNDYKNDVYYVLIALVLVEVEPNHGPACKHQPRRLCRQQRTVRGLNIGLVDARSAVNKAAELHAVIHENLLDILVVVEMRFQSDTLETIALDVTPPAFKVIGVPRSDGRRGGGLAVIYRDHLSVISASTPSSPTSFETQTIRGVWRTLRDYGHLPSSINQPGDDL